MVPDERGNQRSSAVISGHQRSSEVIIRGIRGHQRSSEVIRGHQRSSSEVIRGLVGASRRHLALRRRPREIKGDQGRSRELKGAQGRWHLALRRRPREIKGEQGRSRELAPGFATPTAISYWRTAVWYKRRSRSCSISAIARLTCGERGGGVVMSTCMQGVPRGTRARSHLRDQGRSMEIRENESSLAPARLSLSQ